MTYWVRTLRFIVLFHFIFALPVMARSVPQLTGPVVDEAKIFSSATKNQFSQALIQYHRRHHIQIQVLTIQSLQGDPLEDFSIRLAETWKIGDQATDRGVIVLFVQKERRVRIEVGQGLEGKLTDAQAGRIINQIMVPAFRQGEFEVGIMMGVQGVAEELGYPLRFSGFSPLNIQDYKKPSGIFEVIFFILFLVLFFSRIFFWPLFLGGFRRRRYGRSGFSGRGFGGWSGGGGGFSGGGASGSW